MEQRIATVPLQNGVVTNNTVTSAASHATFIDVWSSASAADGWSIFGARNNAYYDCGTRNNARDGLSIDGSASGLAFFHFQQGGDLRYGVHGDHLVTALAGSTQPTSGIRFFSGLLGDGKGRPAGVSTLYLRNAFDWRFPEMVIEGTNLAGPTVDLDQSNGNGIDLSQCWISSSRSTATTFRHMPRVKRSTPAGPLSANEGYACIQISGTPTDTAKVTFLKIDGCHFLDGDHSIYLKGSPGSYRYSAIGGWRDTTLSGAAVVAGLPAFDTLFDGRTEPWQTATVLAPWSGAVSYRVMGEGWVELKGSVQYSGTGTGPLLSLPPGYRPDGPARRIPAAASSGLAVATIADNGDVSAAPVGATSFPASASVNLDGVSFAIGGS